jgi:hypothetical protein
MCDPKRMLLALFSCSGGTGECDNEPRALIPLMQQPLPPLLLLYATALDEGLTSPSRTAFCVTGCL